MKAITIWQPYASFITAGLKHYETRGWKTSYRGPIAIHAAQRPVGWCLKQVPPAVSDLTVSTFGKEGTRQLPVGQIIAVGELVNVWHICHYPGTNVDKAKYIEIGAESLTTDKHSPDFGAFIIPDPREFILGGWTPGRFAWELANVRALKDPIVAKGNQGLWNWEPETEVNDEMFRV